MTVETLRAHKDNFIYALVEGHECAVIDPGEAQPVLAFLNSRGLKLTHILCTHHHWDHVNGIPEILKQFPVPVWCSAHDQDRVPGQPAAVSGIQILFGREVHVLEVPGHTLGQIAYYIPDLRAVFPGDTLFSAGCGRLFEGSPQQMFSSMKKLATLPADTRVYFGHEYTLNNLKFVEANAAADQDSLRAYQTECLRKIQADQDTTPSTLATELEVNPFLKARDVAEFTKWRELRDLW